MDERGESYVTYATGAKGSKDAEGLRYDLISGIALERLAKVSHEGAERYGDRDWEQGLTVKQCVSRAIRHLSRYCDGDTSEDHLGHAFWRIMAAIHSEAKWPELNEPTPKPSVKSKFLGDPVINMDEEGEFIFMDGKLYRAPDLPVTGATISDFIKANGYHPTYEPT